MPDRNSVLAPAGGLVARTDFARAFRRVPGPVAVVLLRTEDGPVRGITCTSAGSLSAVPPMAVFCVEAKTLFADEVRMARRYSINFLASDRPAWAEAFSRGGASLSSLAHVIGSGRGGAPTLSSGTTAVLECELAEVFPSGDHTIVTGWVTHARSQADAPPLTYLAGRYGEFAELKAGAD